MKSLFGNITRQERLLGSEGSTPPRPLLWGPPWGGREPIWWNSAAGLWGRYSARECVLACLGLVSGRARVCSRSEVGVFDAVVSGARASSTGGLAGWQAWASELCLSEGRGALTVPCWNIEIDRGGLEVDTWLILPEWWASPEG